MIAQAVAELLADHVRLTVEGIDRMYLNVYVPRLQCAYGAVSFFRDHRGQPLASSALMSPMSRRFVAELDRLIARHQLPVVLSRKGQRKDNAMVESLRDFPLDGDFGCLIRIIERDYLHNIVEVYDASGRRHLGEFDPWDGRQIGPPDPMRSMGP